MRKGARIIFAVLYPILTLLGYGSGVAFLGALMYRTGLVRSIDGCNQMPPVEFLFEFTLIVATTPLVCLTLGGFLAWAVFGKYQRFFFLPSVFTFIALACFFLAELLSDKALLDACKNDLVQAEPPVSSMMFGIVGIGFSVVVPFVSMAAYFRALMRERSAPLASPPATH